MDPRAAGQSPLQRAAPRSPTRGGSGSPQSHAPARFENTNEWNQNIRAPARFDIANEWNQNNRVAQAPLADQSRRTSTARGPIASHLRGEGADDLLAGDVGGGPRGTCPPPHCGGALGAGRTVRRGPAALRRRVGGGEAGRNCAHLHLHVVRDRTPPGGVVEHKQAETSARARHAPERCSHDAPIGRGKRGYILMPDQSDAGNAGIFACRTNRTREGSERARG
eukprot:237025-Prorocentrum_minimum.AAC.3